MGDLYIAHEHSFAVFQLVFAMLGMGATLRPRDFMGVFIEPKAVILGSLIQLLVVPLVAFVFIHSLGLLGGVAVGVALIAAVPGGTVSNIFTYLARGNVALSITLTGVVTTAALVTAPFIVELLVSSYVPDDFEMPRGRIMREIALSLLLPLLLGMGYLHLFPRSAALFSKWCVRASIFGILMIAVGASVAGRLDIEAFGLTNLAIVTALMVTLGAAAWAASRAVGLSSRDATAVEVEAMVRNTSLGILLKASLFPAVAGQLDPLGDMIIFTLLLYGGLQLFAGFVVIRLRRGSHLESESQ